MEEGLSEMRARRMTSVFNNLTLSRLIFLIAVLSLNIQIPLVNILGYELKLFHFVFVSAFFLAILYIRLKWGSFFYFAPFLIIVLLSSALSLLAENIEYMQLLPNYVFAFLVFIASLGLARALPMDTQIKSLQVAGWLILFAAIAKTFLSWPQIREYLANPYAHPELFWFYGGGVNLEATFLSMNAAFYRRTKSFWFYWALSFILSVVYASRVGILLGAFSAFLQLASQRSWRAVFLGITLAIAAGIATYSLNPYAFTRFAQVGEETGSTTRLKMWSGAWQALGGLPLLGYGPGSAIRAVEDASGQDFAEDNVHNYPLQVLLDFGLPGLMAWLLICAYILKNAGLLKGSEYGTYTFLYLVAGMVQFRGAEPPFWFILGLLVAMRDYRRSHV